MNDWGLKYELLYHDESCTDDADFNFFLSENITGECEDKSSGCSEFAAQSHYCKHRKMREICPRACSYCGEYWLTFGNGNTTSFQKVIVNTHIPALKIKTIDLSPHKDILAVARRSNSLMQKIVKPVLLFLLP